MSGEVWFTIYNTIHYQGITYDVPLQQYISPEHKFMFVGSGSSNINKIKLIRISACIMHWNSKIHSVAQYSFLQPNINLIQML